MVALSAYTLANRSHDLTRASVGEGGGMSARLAQGLRVDSWITNCRTTSDNVPR